MARHPLYQNLALRLRGEVEGLRPGARIASEPELARLWGVSRFTVARAFAELVEEGLIVRRQGAGSFVAEPPLRRAAGYLLSFTEAVQAAGRRASHRLLAFEPTEWRDGLPFTPDEPLVLLDRLRLVDGVETARHRSVLSADLAAEMGLTPALAAMDGFSLYALFDRHRRSVRRATERLVARSATDEEQRLLGLAAGAVVIAITRHSFDAQGKALDAVEAVYDARLYSYEAELLRQPNPSLSPETDHASTIPPASPPGPRLGPWPEPASRRKRR